MVKIRLLRIGKSRGKKVQELEEKLIKEAQLVWQSIDLDSVESDDDFKAVLNTFRANGFQAKAYTHKKKVALEIRVWKPEYMVKSEYWEMIPKAIYRITLVKPWFKAKRT